MRFRGRQIRLILAAAATSLLFVAGVARADAGKIKLEDASGDTLLKLKPKDGDYKLYDGSDKALGKVRIKGDRVKLKDAAGKQIWTIKHKSAEKVEIEDPAGTRLYLIKKTGNGSWKVTDASEKFVTKLKPKDGRISLKNEKGDSTGKVVVDGDRLKIKSDSGETRLQVKGLTDVRAGAWFAVESFEPMQRAALVVYFLKVHR